MINLDLTKNIQLCRLLVDFGTLTIEIQASFNFLTKKIILEVHKDLQLESKLKTFSNFHPFLLSGTRALRIQSFGSYKPFQLLHCLHLLY